MDPLGRERAMTILSMLNEQCTNATIIKKVRGCTTNLLEVIRRYSASLDKETKIERMAKLQPYAPMQVLINTMQGV
jgi:hypothetical protein